MEVNMVSDSEIGLHRYENEILSHDLIDYYESIEPIPLTEEILLSLGFEKFHEGMDKYYKQREWENNIDMISIFNGQFIYLNGFHRYTEIAVVKYLHQLQNLYFALCGKELELKPKQ